MECAHINVNTPFSFDPSEPDKPFENNLYPPLVYAERRSGGVYLSGVVYGPMGDDSPTTPNSITLGEEIKIKVPSSYTNPTNEFDAWFFEKFYPVNLPGDEVQFVVLLEVDETGTPQDGPRTSRGTRVSVKSSASSDKA